MDNLLRLLRNQIMHISLNISIIIKHVIWDKIHEIYASMNPFILKYNCQYAHGLRSVMFLLLSIAHNP